VFVQFAGKCLRIEGISIYDLQFTMYDVRCTMYNLQFTIYDVRCTIGDEDEAMDGVTELRKAPLREGATASARTIRVVFHDITWCLPYDLLLVREDYEVEQQ